MGVSRNYGDAFANTAERRKLASSLSMRSRREWHKKLMEVQEEVEAVEAKRAKLFADAYAAGIAVQGIETATGLGPQSVRNWIVDAWRAIEDRKANR